MAPTADLLTTSGAARLLGMSESGVRLLAERGDITVARTQSGIRLYDRAVIESLVRERRDSRRTDHGDEAA